MKILLALMIALSIACQQKEPVLPGRLDRVSDVVMTDCHPYDSSDSLHTCVIFANPRIEQLQIFDATTKQFVIGATFLPEPVKVGPSTRKLAINTQIPFVFGLDTVSDQIFVVQTRRITDGDSTFSQVNSISTSKGPSSIAVDSDATRGTRAIITLPASGSIEVIPLDANSGKKHATNPSFQVSLGANKKPIEIKLDTSGAIAVITDAIDSNITIIRTQNLTRGIPDANLERVDMGGPTARVALGRIKITGVDEDVALVLRKDAFKAKLVSLRKPATVLQEITLDSYPLVPYVPNEESTTCCNGEKSWVSIITSTGKLNHIKIGGSIIAGVTMTIANTADLTVKKSQSQLVGLASAIVSGKVINAADNCERKTFYAFETNFAGVACEGDSTVNQIDAL